MFAMIVLYGFALPSDIEKMKTKLLAEHGIKVKRCHRDESVKLADDDAQILCTLYRVPQHTRHDEHAITRLLYDVRSTIVQVTAVKTAVVVDSKKDAVPTTSERGAVVS